MRAGFHHKYVVDVLTDPELNGWTIRGAYDFRNGPHSHVWMSLIDARMEQLAAEGRRKGDNGSAH